MTWQYRIMVRRYPDEVEYSVIEAHYDEPGVNPPIVAWSYGSAPAGETMDSLVADLQLMRLATAHPVVEYTDLPGRKE